MTLPNLFSAVLNMSLTGSLVILAVLAARLALRRAPKLFSYLLWAVVLFRLLCPVSLPSPLSAFALARASLVPSPVAGTGMEYVDTYREVVAEPLVPGEERAPPVSRRTAPAARERSPRDLIPPLWLAGAAGMLLWGLVSSLRFRRHLTGAVPAGAGVYLADHLGGAFVVGLFFPRIYLPSDLSGGEREYILAHERCHLARLDHVTRHLAFLALSIHWFNPLVWAAFLLSGRDMELSCDEAVLRKLGGAIRADYAASLLRLAACRPIIPGSPLAFGEGSTKERIRNMINWKRPRRGACAAAALLCLAILTACAANPTEQVVISKNDGAFDANVVQSAGEVQAGQEQALRYAERFTSTDGSVEYLLDIDTRIPDRAMPVVEVAPHFFTSEDAQRIARVLLGEGDFFETEPWMAPAQQRLSRQEALDTIARWSTYATAEGFARLHPQWRDAPELLEKGAQYVRDCIDQYTGLLEEFPRENAHEPAKWQYQQSSLYFYTPEQITELKADTSEDHPQMLVSAQRDGIPYWLEFSIRDDSLFKLSNLYLRLSQDFSPYDVDSLYYRQTLLATEKPGDAQMRAAQEQAQALLDQMDIGLWQVDDCYLSIQPESQPLEYTIVVTAVPVFEGVPALRRNQLGNLRSDTAYASNFYLTDATFSFSPEGRIIACEIFSPVEVIRVLNPNTAVLDTDELVQRAKKHLALFDLESYGASGMYLSQMEQLAGEEYRCQVRISGLEYGLIRVKAPNTDDRYYYVPGLLLKGSVDYVGAQSGKIYESAQTNAPLVAINAVDGSVIELDNPLPG